MGGPKLYQLYKSEQRYKDLKREFMKTWEESGELVPRIKDIYYVRDPDLSRTHRGRRFDNYLSQHGGIWEHAFHGTNRECHIGDPKNGVENGHLKCCGDNICGICGIIRKSFKMAHAGAGMFGRGIYISKSSFKADMFQDNACPGSLEMILVVRYVPGVKQFLKKADSVRTGPDPGFDSVEAVLRKDGGAVNHPESVVYRDEAIVPVGVIVYSRDSYYDLTHDGKIND